MQTHYTTLHTHKRKKNRKSGCMENRVCHPFRLTWKLIFAPNPNPYNAGKEWSQIKINTRIQHQYIFYHPTSFTTHVILTVSVLWNPISTIYNSYTLIFDFILFSQKFICLPLRPKFYILLVCFCCCSTYCWIQEFTIRIKKDKTKINKKFLRSEFQEYRTSKSIE